MKKILSFLMSSTLILSSIGNSIACTSLVITDAKGNAYKGRGWEFSVDTPAMLTYLPAGGKIESFTPSGAKGKVFETKHPILGITLEVLPGVTRPLFLDAINDQGLTMSIQALNNSSGPAVGNDNSKVMAVVDLGTWILGNFKTTAEVKTALLSGDTQIWLPLIPVMGNVTSPMHYAFWDKSGNGIVLEFQNGKMNVYDNPVNVMTNGPEFPWHLSNLNNYTFTNKDKNTGQLGKLKLATEDAGIALAGLPSAQTSQGRFVKAAFYANYVRKAKTPDDAVVTLGHIMNNFDRPYDLTVDGAGGVGDGPRTKSLSSESSRYMLMTDLARGRFYVRTIDALNWSIVDMNKLKGLTAVKTFPIADIDKGTADPYTLFYK
ncbi:linear amide C-N hydrolase [Polynucleobacter sp. 86C-FISCH]|uniref:linear amide C-N hydrolase n=1 Tax=Polynucleobacter sp. 86C-FISCH TaxID=2689101 RepID=UPI001C0B3F3C|nr:linear amide C-N hydrolase [Polynucleobacter sp. 86C-FISCH]MBU3595126.1 linear amide C-N hydrolase [Polynucleobacter sp. 86C-FISCH]